MRYRILPTIVALAIMPASVPAITAATGLVAPPRRGAPDAGQMPTIDIRSGDTVMVRTSNTCETGRVADVSSVAMALRVEGDARVRRIETVAVLAIMKIERAPTSKTPRILATVGLGAAAIAAGRADRRGASVALGISAWLIPWWGVDERKVGRLIYRAPGDVAARLDPVPGPCDAAVRQALGLARR